MSLQSTIQRFCPYFQQDLPPQTAKYHGLVNQGATCYLNSVLQVLFMTEDFKSAVERYARENSDSECIDLQLDALFKDLERKTAKTNSITWKLNIDTVYNPRDAAEYFEKILNLTSPAASKVFHGALTNRTKCSSCGEKTETDVPFLHLPLALPNLSHNSVMDSLEEHFRVSNLTGDDQIYCDACDKKCDFKYKCVMKQCPDVLMLLLKRFQLDYRTMNYIKNNCKVYIPLSIKIPKARQTYVLHAVVDHFGDLRNGHYTATVKDGEHRYCFNDTTVTSGDWEKFNVDSTSAYLLFYKKQKDDCKNGSMAPCSPPADSSVCHPGGKRKREKAEEASGVDSEVEEHGDTKHFSSDWKVREEQTDTEEDGGDGGIHSTPTTCDPADLDKCHRQSNQRATLDLNSVLKMLFMKEFKIATERYADKNSDFKCIDLVLGALFKDLKMKTSATHSIKLSMDAGPKGLVAHLTEYRVNNCYDAKCFEKTFNSSSPTPSKVFFGDLTNIIIYSSCQTNTQTDLPPHHALKNYRVDCVMKQRSDVLMLLLKRLQWDQGSMTDVKNYCKVDTPSSLQSQTASQTYTLYAAVDLRNGHYTATITDGEHWYCFDGTINMLVNCEKFNVDTRSADLFDKKQKDGEIDTGPRVGTEVEKPGTEDFCSDGRARVSSRHVSGQFEQSEKKEEQTQPEEHGLDGVTHSNPTTIDPADLGKMKEGLKPKKHRRNERRRLAANLGGHIHQRDSEVRPGLGLNDDDSKISQKPECYVKIIGEEFRS